MLHNLSYLNIHTYKRTRDINDSLYFVMEEVISRKTFLCFSSPSPPARQENNPEDFLLSSIIGLLRTTCSTGQVTHTRCSITYISLFMPTVCSIVNDMFLLSHLKLYYILKIYFKSFPWSIKKILKKNKKWNWGRLLPSVRTAQRNNAFLVVYSQ